MLDWNALRAQQAEKRKNAPRYEQGIGTDVRERKAHFVACEQQMSQQQDAEEYVFSWQEKLFSRVCA